MKSEVLPEGVGGYKSVGFSPRLQKLMAAKAAKYQCREASDTELWAFVLAAREVVPGLASDDVLRRMRQKNPGVFQTVLEIESKRAIGFTAQIPLTEEGLAAVLDGSFRPSEPETRFLADPGAQVEAIYSWLIYSPSSFVAVTAALGEYVARVAPMGVSIFCRAANDKARRAFEASGYEPAMRSYPGAPSDLLVVHAQRSAPVEPTTARQPTILIDVARDWQDMAKISAIRAATYMADQHCPFDEEFDGNDFCGAHLLGTIDGEPAGCVRIRFFGEFVKIERLAVRREFRNSRLAFRLARAAVDFAAAKGFKRMYGHARSDLVRFWRSFGFRPIEGRPRFSFSDVEYVEMEGEIPSGDRPVNLANSPFVLIRPEGKWEQPGPLERKIDPTRAMRIKNALR